MIKAFIILFLPVLALFSALVQILLIEEVPTPEDWKAAALQVEKGWEEGDVLLVLPHWAEEGRIYLGRQRNQQEQLWLKEVEERELAPYRRLWLITAFSALDRDYTYPYLKLQKQIKFSRLQISLFQIKTVQSLFRMSQQIESARVERIFVDHQEKCDFWAQQSWHCDLQKSAVLTRQCLGMTVDARWQRKWECLNGSEESLSCGGQYCGLHPWSYVGVVYKEIGNLPRRCIWFHPQPPAKMRITFPQVKIGRKFRLFFGTTDQAFRVSDRSPVEFKLFFNHEVKIKKLQPLPFGWNHLDLDTSNQKGTIRDISLEIYTVRSEFAHFCFDGEMLAPRD